MSSPRSDSLVGLARVAVAGVIWGSIPLVLDAANGASLIKVFYRVFFAGIALAIYMALSGRMSEVTALPRKKVRQLAGQGALLCLNWLLFLTALDMTSVATAELLAYTGPVFVAALAPFVSRERFDVRVLLPLALALGGVTLILAQQGISLSGGRQTIGALLAFCSALTYAALLLRSKRILQGVSGSALMVVEYATASLLLLPFVLWLYATGQGPTGPGSYAALLTLGIVQTAIAGIIFLGGLRRVRTDHAAILTYAEPVSAVILAALFLRQPVSWYTALGAALVVTGGALVARIDTRDAGTGHEVATAADRTR